MLQLAHIVAHSWVIPAQRTCPSLMSKWVNTDSAVKTTKLVEEWQEDEQALHKMAQAGNWGAIRYLLTASRNHSFRAGDFGNTIITM